MVANSIRSNLLRWLIVPITLLLVVGAVGDYRMALQSATRAYDGELLNTALAVFGQLTNTGNRIGLDFPPAAERVLMLDQYDQTYYAVTKANHELVAGVPDLPESTLPQDALGYAYYDSEFRGKPVRVTAMTLPYAGTLIRIQAAQTVLKRQRLARDIMVRMLLPEFLMAVATLALVWFGVGKGLEPVLQVRNNLAARSDRDLHPIPEASAPAEIRPVLKALNAFLDRLRKSLDTQTRFLSNAAHQLRTPLAALQSQIEFGLRQHDPSAWKQTLDKALLGTRRTVRIANQLLALARAEPGAHRDETFRACDLSALVQATASEWVNTAIVAGKDLGLELSTALAVGDPVLLREMISNVVDNAIKYTPPNARITVRTYTTVKGAVQGAVLEVEDDGPGIPPDQWSLVFERFYRLDGTKGDGCGLGLAIVREVADIHGAIVTLSDQRNERGTRVRVEFPAMPMAPLQSEEIAIAH